MSDPAPRILVVDDEFSVRDALSRWLTKDGHRVESADCAEAALELEGPFAVAVVDVRMPGMDGLELLARLRERDPETAVIIITAFASVESAVRALKEGAFDYITKPVDPDELSHLVHRALEQRRLRDENQQLRRTIDGLVAPDAIVGESEAIRGVMGLVARVAPTDATVLITGESGTGKELVARAIHANSPRRYAPIVAVNCGAVPDTLLESELFGHEKGAFTGATHRRKGKLEMAHGGTLFLDEIGVIGARMQVELLRVLEEKAFTRVGGAETVRSDFRVICATNERLDEAVREGRFREDLYYRVQVFAIEVPPLRERRSDIPLLCEHFMRHYAHRMDRQFTSIAPEAMETLRAHAWPGNVRELCNAMERAMVVGHPPTIRAEDLPIRAPGGAGEPAGDGDESLEAVERRHVASVLDRTGWNISRAARVLRVDRVTVYNKIRKYGLER